MARPAVLSQTAVTASATSLLARYLRRGPPGGHRRAFKAEAELTSVRASTGGWRIAHKAGVVEEGEVLLARRQSWLRG